MTEPAESKVVTSVAMTSRVVAMGEIHLRPEDVGDGEQREHRDDDDVERTGAARRRRPGQHVGDETAVARVDEHGEDDDEDTADDGGTERLDELHGATAHEQVRAHADRQEQDADAAHPAERA